MELEERTIEELPERCGNCGATLTGEEKQRILDEGASLALCTICAAEAGAVPDDEGRGRGALLRRGGRRRLGHRAHRLQCRARQAADDHHVERLVAAELGIGRPRVRGGDADGALAARPSRSKWLR